MLNGLAHLTFTQRSIHAVLPIRVAIPKVGKQVRGEPQTLGDLLVASRKKAGLKQTELSLATGIPRKWLLRWERNRAVQSQEDLNKLFRILKLDWGESVWTALLPNFAAQYNEHNTRGFAVEPSPSPCQNRST